ncbi:MAG TPA: hypothetical protein VFF31_18060 [Blastocatellia bacterium]|nr:hypothetical protein [Blastocatellia bacterium]
MLIITDYDESLLIDPSYRPAASQDAKDLGNKTLKQAAASSESPQRTKEEE